MTTFQLASAQGWNSDDEVLLATLNFFLFDLLPSRRLSLSLPASSFRTLLSHLAADHKGKVRTGCSLSYFLNTFIKVDL